MATTVREKLTPLVNRRLPVALLDFPRFANIGDSAIWAGATRCLESIGIRPAFTCDAKSYDRRELAARVETGTILLPGGGNLGDLYPWRQSLREQVIRSFPDNPIVQLPQTIHFESREALNRARAVFAGHDNFTLLVRDRRSLEIARSELGTRSELCPDMALCLGALERPVEASVPVVWLMRSDAEASAQPFAERRPEDWVDWKAEPRNAVYRLHSWTTSLSRRSALGRRFLRGPVMASQDRLADWRVERGCAMLSRGRSVVTDRLHGHILCLLLGIPHVLLDNSYGKNRRVFRTWMSDRVSGARWAGSHTEAAELAAELAGNPAAGPAAEQQPSEAE